MPGVAPPAYLSLRLPVVYMMLPSASLTAIHYMCQTLMISAIIYSFEFGLRLRPKSRPSASAAHRLQAPAELGMTTA